MTLRELLTTKPDEILRVAAKRGAPNVRLFGSVASMLYGGDRSWQAVAVG